LEYAIGIAIALTITVGATALGFDRERVFYPAVMIAVATYYVLFAAMSGSASVVITESLAASAFLLLNIIGFKTRLWLVVAALAGHGVFDFFHHLIIDDPAVPPWWPGFCGAFDIVAAGYLAVLLTKRSGLTRPNYQ
jgi:hypothetical protein